jgi:DNA-cytosine methyltransferase
MNLIDILAKEIASSCQTDAVALWLSGGYDSLTVGLACEAAGKRVTAYTFEIDGVVSKDRLKAEEISSRRGWKLKIVQAAPRALAADFVHLATALRCRSKVQFEVGYPTMHLTSATQQIEILTGWNADDHYGNTAKFMRDMSHFKRKNTESNQLQAFFDDHRIAVYAAFDAPSSEDTFWLASRICAQQGKRLIDPYIAPAVRSFFAAFDHATLSRPSKPLIREQILLHDPSLADLELLSGVKFQKGSSVDAGFQRLLDDARINRFEKRYVAVSQLCQRWAKEVVANENGMSEIAASLPDRISPTILRSQYGSLATWRMSDVRSASATASFNVISLFTGAGGSCLGQMMAGGRILLANEFIPAAAATYRRNFPDTLMDCSNVRSLVSAPKRMIELLNKVGLKPGDIDVLDGSPPCSEFSVAGKGMVDSTVMKPYSDSSQRDISSLPLDYVAAAQIIAPKVMLMENVPGLAGRGREILEAVIDTLTFDYFIAWRISNAAHFGVPQARRRLFIIGVRKDVGRPIGIDCDELVAGIFPNPTVPGTTVRSALSDLEQTASDIRPWLQSARISGLEDKIALLPKKPAKLTRLNDILERVDHDFTLTRCSWDKPAPTLTVTSQQPTGLAGAIHPEQNRKFSIPELKRLFGVPDDFILTGTVAQAAERLCRMVPPPLTAAIASRIHERVLLPYRAVKHD